MGSMVHDIPGRAADPAETIERAKDEVAAKVRKLLVQAEDPAATPEEAHSFTMKAQQLMTKYSISLAMVTDATRIDQVIQRGWTVQNPYAGHRVSLINAIARANDCRAIYDNLPGGRKRIDVVGYPGDVEWVHTLTTSLESQLAGALATALANKPPDVHGRTYSVGFIRGFITEVSHRLQRARREAVEAAEAAREAERRVAERLAVEAGLAPAAVATPSVAVVLVEKKNRVDAEFHVRHPGSRTVYSSVRLGSWSGFAPGRAAGSRASLARGSVGDSHRSLSA